jgi:CHASE3 domain sensor protein
MKELLQNLPEELSHLILTAHKKAVEAAVLANTVALRRDDLRKAIDKYSDDPTGQDGDDHCKQAASDYIEAQDEAMGYCEDQIAEMRAGA